MASRLLLVEDEPGLVMTLTDRLVAEGYDVEAVTDGESGLTRATAESFDLIVLDGMLPGRDGFDVCRSVRQRGVQTPILMLTARGRAEDVLRGFEAGADDYLPKPFELSILLARIHALVRRHAWHRAPLSAGEAPIDTPDVYTFGDRTADFNAQELRVGTNSHPLTLMETNLLRYLVQHEGQVVSRKSMLEDVWNLREDTDTRAIDHFIARLRKYLEKEPAKPRHLLTVRGVGYKFVAAPRK